MNAAEMQDKLRAGGRSLLDRLRRFGVGVLSGTDAYWAERSDDVDAWPHYRVEQGGGDPTLFITGSCAEIHGPELHYRLEGRIYIDTGNLRTSGRARRFGTRQRMITPFLFRSFPRRG